MPFWAARIISGSAARSAAMASVWLPEAIASSTLRTKVRMRLRRDLLIAVRFAILRVIFLADTVLAMANPRLLKVRRDKLGLELRQRPVDEWKPKSPRDARARVERLIETIFKNVNVCGPLRVKKAPREFPQARPTAFGARDWQGRGAVAGPLP